MTNVIPAILAAAALCLSARSQDVPHPPPSSYKTFTNPLLPTGPDPWVIQHDGFYFYMNTTGTNLTIWKTRSVPDLATAEKKVVWTPPSGQLYSQQVWAPELHFLRGKWYIYFTADHGSNADHRLWVISNASPDPLTGSWSEPKALLTPGNRWAIDATVFENQADLYLVWSGWKGKNDGVQNIYIAHLKDPVTIDSPRVQISHPKLRWETIGDLPARHIDVNEGPEVLRHGDTFILTYSASGCWTDSYTLGELTASAQSNLLSPKSWHKLRHPVLATSQRARAYGPGHNGFFKSPDGKEDWVIYHANPSPGQGCADHRSPRAQRITWLSDGTASFGEPVPLGQPIPVPSGAETGK